MDLPSEWIPLIDNYRDVLFAKGSSPHVVKTYPLTAAYCLTRLRELGIQNLRDIAPEHLMAFHRHLLDILHHGKPLSLRTVRRYLVEVKSFFQHLHKTNVLFWNPATGLTLPNPGRLLPRFHLSVKEITTLVEAPDLTTPLGVRDRAILELLYSSGLRNTELRHLELKHLNLEAEQVFVRGKGGKEAFVPFGKSARKAMVLYLSFARSHLSNPALKRPAEYLFLSKTGRPLTQQNLIDILRKYAQQAGLKGPVTPHTLRHGCATHLLQRGADLRHIQALLRHEDLKTTQSYTHLDMEDLKAAQRRYHPREAHRPLERAV